MPHQHSAMMEMGLAALTLRWLVFIKLWNQVTSLWGKERHFGSLMKCKWAMEKWCCKIVLSLHCRLFQSRNIRQAPPCLFQRLHNCLKINEWETHVENMIVFYSIQPQAFRHLGKCQWKTRLIECSLFKTNKYTHVQDDMFINLNPVTLTLLLPSSNIVRASVMWSNQPTSKQRDGPCQELYDSLCCRFPLNACILHIDKSHKAVKHSISQHLSKKKKPFHLIDL